MTRSCGRATDRALRQAIPRVLSLVAAGFHLCVPGLAGRSEDFSYASDNVRSFCFLFEEALPVIGPQCIGGPVGGNGVLRMEALKLGALLGGDDGVRVGHISMLVPSGAIRLGRGKFRQRGALSPAPARTGERSFSTTIRIYLLTTIRGHAKIRLSSSFRVGCEGDKPGRQNAPREERNCAV